MNFSFNTPIRFQSKRRLWAGLVYGSLVLRVCRSPFSSEIRIGHNEQDKEILVRDGKSRPKQTKMLSDRKELEGTSEKAFKQALPSETDVSLEGGKNSEDRLNAGPLLSFPFDGSNYSEIGDEFNMRHCTSRSSADNLLVQRMDDYRSEGRFYRIQSAGARVLFPSVTTVLNSTPTRPQYYRLRNWEKSMIKQHGEEQFRNIQQLTKDVGTCFHQVRIII